MESIVFRWQANRDNNAEWVAIDANGRPHVSVKSGSLDELSRQLRSQTQKKHPIMLLSASYYSMHQVSLPPKLSLNNVKKAAPYAIEDELVDSIDSYHFACGNIIKEDDATIAQVAAINKDALSELLAILAEHQIKPKSVYPENLLLPENNASTSIFIEGEDIHARLHNGLAHTLHLDLLPELLDEFDDTESIKIISEQELELPIDQEKNIEHVLSDKPLLSIFAKQLNQYKPVNILQGEFKHQEELGKHFTPWRWPFALAAVALVVALVTQLVTVNKLEKQNIALEEEKIAIYKSAFPRSRNIDPYSVRTRMDQALKKAGSSTATSSQFIPLLEKYAQLSSSENALKINNIDYNKDKLSLTLTAKDIQVLDQIKINLEKNQGIVANILSSKAVGDGIEATLKLETR